MLFIDSLNIYCVTIIITVLLSGDIYIGDIPTSITYISSLHEPIF